jgi:hypothetical protein
LKAEHYGQNSKELSEKVYNIIILKTLKSGFDAVRRRSEASQTSKNLVKSKINLNISTDNLK